MVLRWELWMIVEFGTVPTFETLDNFPELFWTRSEFFELHKMWLFSYPTKIVVLFVGEVIICIARRPTCWYQNSTGIVPAVADEHTALQA